MTNLVKTLHGPLFVGIIFSVFLYGITVTQSYLYYTTYKKDPKWLKFLVLAALVLDTVNTIFNVFGLYSLLINNFGNFNEALKVSWIFVAEPVVTTIVAMMVQMFFTWRIYVLMQSWVVVGTVVSLSIAAGVGALIITSDMATMGDLSELQEIWSVSILWLAGSSATDILITSILVWYLRKHKTGLKQPDMMIDRVIRVTIQTGLLTTTIVLLNLIFYLVFPNNGVHLGLNTVVCKLYSNSLMSNLNSRKGQESTARSHQLTSSLVFQNPEGMVEQSGSNGGASFIPQRPNSKAANSSSPPNWEEKDRTEIFNVKVHAGPHEASDTNS